MSTLGERVDRLGKLFQEIAYNAQDKLESAVEVGSKRIDLMGLRRGVDRETRALGEVALGYLRRGQAAELSQDPAAQAAVQRLSSLEAEIRGLEAELEVIRNRRRRAGSGPAPGGPAAAGAAGPSSGEPSASD